MLNPLAWWRRRRQRRHCFHHDHIDGTTWIRSRLVDLGRAKHFWCDRCGTYWVR
jgi:hypothetical protein